MLDFFKFDDASLITWFHAVNNKKKLNDSLNSDCNFLEADIVYDENKHVEPIMAHPPDDSSDLTFKEFIQAAKDSKKGLKLDFKTISSVRPCLEYLRTLSLNCPVILNADVLQGNNSPPVVIDPVEFVQTCSHLYPMGILSLGWTTTPCPRTYYTKENIQQAIGLCEKLNLLNKKIHFAIRLSWSIKSINELIYLHKMTDCLYTIWSHNTDQIDSIESILLFRYFFDHNILFYDLSSDQFNYLNENKLNYKAILSNSSDKIVKSYLLRSNEIDSNQK